MLSSVIKQYNQIIFYKSSLNRIYTKTTNEVVQVLPTYYKLTNLLWQDGLIIDFLQKKILDKWIRQFLINSSNIFNERIVFKFVIKFYMDFLLWPQNTYSYFELRNVASVLTVIWLTLSLVVLLANLNWLFTIIIGF
jgi:hypothetical protein